MLIGQRGIVDGVDIMCVFVQFASLAVFSRSKLLFWDSKWAMCFTQRDVNQPNRCNT